MMKCLNAVQQNWYTSIFLQRDWNRIARVAAPLRGGAPDVADKDFLLAHIAGAEIVVTSWDTARLDADVLAVARNLRLVVHAAGSVKPIVSKALWTQGVQVVSMAAAISYGVAEYCLGCMLTASKRLFWAVEGTRRGQWKEGLKAYGGPFELYSQKVGIIGMGHVGRHLARLLQGFTCETLVYDPYFDRTQADQHEVQPVASLDELFAQCRVVVLCAAGNDQTRGMITKRHFECVPDGALFINVSRGGIFAEEDLGEALAGGRFVACVDVTEVEPTPVDHPYRKVPNLLFTPHVAGVVAQNMLRLGTMAANEIESFMIGRTLQFEVTEDMLNRVA